MPTLNKPGARIAAAGAAAAALALAAGTPAFAQEAETPVTASFSLQVNTVWGLDEGIYEDGQYGRFGYDIDDTTVSEETEPFDVETVFDFSASEGIVEIELLDDERCERAGSVVTCVDEDVDHDRLWSLYYGDYGFLVSVGEDGQAGDRAPYRGTVAIDGVVVNETEDFIQISDEYGTWEYDPSMDHSTDHEPGDYDLAVQDRDIEGEAGETVTVSIDVANLGPLDAVAPVHSGAGEGSYRVEIQLPTGVESAWADGSDDYFSENGVQCIQARPTPYPIIDRSLPADTGITENDINCYFDSVSVAEGAHLEFPVVIADAAPAEDGIIAINESMALDADYGNNVAVLSLNSGTAPAEDGTTPAASGKLPTTGNSSIVMVSAAAAAIAVGAAVFFVMRRRRVAQNWE